MDDVLNQLRTELSGRYEVEQELGSGGMAVVYLAKDLRHDRRVAIKVLRQDVGGASAERFLREIRTVAQLHHPHILQLLDSGTAGDHLFYVMPYVEGETIRQRLEREGPLPIDEAVRIAREVADALSFAHARGIVHRDIKPENVFLSAGHALVADFGIARAAESAASATLTDAGLAVGTPSYMSPEQATADPRVDGRSDQYALGCVVYEMLAGAPPFTGPTSQAIMARHTADPVPPLRTVRDVPASLESAITRALAKVPADRWSSVSEFANSLDLAVPRGSGYLQPQPSGARWRRPVALGGLAAVVLVATFGYRALSSPARPVAGATVDSLRSIALRPFAYSGDTTYDWVAETFADGLLPGLSKVNGIIVKSPNQTRVEVAQADDPVEIGQRLKVDAVLSGEVQVRGNFLRVSARLTNVADGSIRWHGNLNGELDVDGAPRDIYRIMDSMAVEIVGELRPEFNAERRAVAERGLRTTNLQALALYQRARSETGVARTAESWRRARDLLTQALKLDTSFADAMVFLHVATVSSMLGTGHTPDEAAAAVDGLLDRAIRVDSMNAMAFATRARFRAGFKWEWDESLADYRRALALSPSSPDVLWEYAFSLNERDQRDSAVVYARRAFALSETNAESLHDLSVVLYTAGRTDSALSAATIALQLNPGWTNYYVPMHSLFDLGRRAEADSMAVRYLGSADDGGYCCTQSLAYAAGYFLRSNNASRAREMLDSIRAHARRGSVPGSEMAAAYLAVGDRAKALDELDRAVRERDNMLPTNLWLLLSPLAGERRYEDAFRRVYGDRPARRQFR